MKEDLVNMNNKLTTLSEELTSVQSVINNDDSSKLQKNSAEEQKEVLEGKIKKLNTQITNKRERVALFTGYLESNESCYAHGTNNRLVLGGLDKISTDNCYTTEGIRTNITDENTCIENKHEWVPKIDGCEERSPYYIRQGKLIKKGHVLKSIRIDEIVDHHLLKANSTIHILINKKNGNGKKPLTIEEKREKIKNMPEERRQTYIGNKNVDSINEVEINTVR